MMDGDKFQSQWDQQFLLQFKNKPKIFWNTF